MKLLNEALDRIDPRNRSLLEKYLPWFLVAVVVWLASKSFKKIFWTAFGMYWAMRGSGIHLF